MGSDINAIPGTRRRQTREDLQFAGAGSDPAGRRAGGLRPTSSGPVRGRHPGRTDRLHPRWRDPLLRRGTPGRCHRLPGRSAGATRRAARRFRAAPGCWTAWAGSTCPRMSGTGRIRGSRGLGHPLDHPTTSRNADPSTLAAESSSVPSLDEPRVLAAESYSVPSLDEPPVLALPSADDDEVNALLDVAMPATTVRPGDRSSRRWYDIRDDDVLVACGADRSGYLPSPAPVGVVGGIAVHPAYRGRGYGTALSAARHAPAVRRIRPGHAGRHPENGTANRIYERLGYTSRWEITSVRVVRSGTFRPPRLQVGLDRELSAHPADLAWGISHVESRSRTRRRGTW